jgi:hypothetical protein
VNLGGMLIEGVGSLGAEVAVPEVEVKRADAVRAVDAGELRASLDPVCSVVSHDLIVSPSKRGSGARWSGGEGNGAVGSRSTIDIEICTKPLARRTLSRVRGRQVGWDDARARLQVIICVCA